MRAFVLVVLVVSLASCSDSDREPSGPTFDADIFRDVGARDLGSDDDALVPPRDGSIDGARDAATRDDDGGDDRDASTPVACDGPRVCSAPSMDDATLFSIVLDTTFEDGNVLFHSGIATSSGPVVPWVAQLCCGADPKPIASGVVRLDRSEIGVRLFGPSTDVSAPIAPAVALVGDALWVADPTALFARVARLDVALDGAGDAIEAALATDAAATPALATLDDGRVLALVPMATTTELRVLEPDGSLASTIDLARTTTRVAITRTCRGLLATWEEGRDALAMPIDAVGTPAAAPTIYGETGIETQAGLRNVVFDGAHVVTVGPRQIYELEPDGTVASTTLSLLAPVAAVGTDDGVIVLHHEAADGDGAPVVLVERESGAFLRELARIDTGDFYANDGVVIVDPGSSGSPTSVTFGAASYVRRGLVVGARIACVAR